MKAAKKERKEKKRKKKKGRKEEKERRKEGLKGRKEGRGKRKLLYQNCLCLSDMLAKTETPKTRIKYKMYNTDCS